MSGCTGPAFESAPTDTDDVTEAKDRLVDSKSVAIISPDDAEAETGKTYGEWSAKWWKVMLAIPIDTNPTFDTTGANCGFGETADMFFLAGEGSGTAVTRTCTVPATKPLFFPIINVECSNVEKAPFRGKDDEARAACAAHFADDIGINTLKVTLDGGDVHNLHRFRAASPPFDFTMPKNDNILFVPGKTSGRSASDGYWVMLELPPGDHELHFEGAFTKGPGAGFFQDVTYHLTVQ
ncbi:hypothetical protein [Polyangium sp. 15x6]|uniref:hypothetical protein n=1 Tax=Polyangium sp. 15x6 TaxID=3042687 RepID=UPI00249CAF5B|nr:hypothetical protein [Polyangium sp. 15x6]MDI3285319.1 hypothetical protein [Polyangium sp. 15x6]